MGLKELLKGDDFDKESSLGETDLGDGGGLGGSLESAGLRELNEELVEFFDSKLRGWDEVVGKSRISEQEPRAREVRSDSALRERTKPPHNRFDGGLVTRKSEVADSSSSSSSLSSSNQPIVGKSPDSSTGLEARSKSPMSKKDSAKLKSPIEARDIFFFPLVLTMVLFVLYIATGGLRIASRASVANDND